MSRAASSALIDRAVNEWPSTSCTSRATRSRSATSASSARASSDCSSSSAKTRIAAQNPMIGHTIRKKKAGKSPPTSESTGSSALTTVVHFHHGAGTISAENAPRYGVSPMASMPITGTVATASSSMANQIVSA